MAELTSMTIIDPGYSGQRRFVRPRTWQTVTVYKHRRRWSGALPASGEAAALRAGAWRPRPGGWRPPASGAKRPRT
ncbi:hypothetical protein QJS66_10435 [Kocuria rhizophila]|nr:hypothetical protein QJS66_10435 [Kocuria rhizophila]